MSNSRYGRASGAEGWVLSTQYSETAEPRLLRFTHPTGARPYRRGMTLVELLVVVGILALLTSVAVTSADVFVGQGRHDATRMTLSAIEEGVLGPAAGRQADGTLVVSGFVADVGRLPVCASADPCYTLAELWTNPGGLAPFAIRPAPFDPEVLVPSGWRGPYVRLPIGSDHLRDGWGNRFVPVNLAGNPAALNEPIAAVRSLGADALARGTAYNADLEVVLNRPLMTARGNVYVLDASGQPQNPGDPSQVSVRLYGPNVAPDGGIELVLPTTVDGAVVSYTTGPITAGPHFLRAYLGSPPSRRSRIVRFERGDVINLEIR